MRRFVPLLTALLAASCGGGGGDGGGGVANPPSQQPPASGWAPGVFLPSATFAAQCPAPRTGTHPITGLPWPDVQGTVLDVNNWLRSWSNELYLWYDEIVDRDPGLYSTSAYFDLLKTNAVTASGQPKDRFHFTVPTDEWIELTLNAVTAGYGAEWVILSGAPPRHVVVAYVEPGSPADDAGLTRGASVTAIDGFDINTATPDQLNAAFFPQQPGETHTFWIRDRNSPATPRPVQMTSEQIATTPVLHWDVLPDNVGYILFNDHLAPAEAQLIEAFEGLAAAGVTDLVLDLRYNGGGFLVIAAELAYMIAGPVRTAGRIFERLVFNDKHTATNPVTGDPLEPVPFQPFALGLSAPGGTPLPSLDLSRVFVLTGTNTCSASESVINGLRGIDFEVIQIGGPTCGKPYGFYPADNCGTTYFSIQFKGENEKNYGDYADGFTPDPAGGNGIDRLLGCLVGDDFTHELGDPAERRLAAALEYRASRTCPPPSTLPLTLSKPTGADIIRDGELRKGPYRENRILGLP